MGNFFGKTALLLLPEAAHHFFSEKVMKYFQRFLTLLFIISILASVTVRSFAQSKCSGRLYGIPICSGFSVDHDTSSIHRRINTLEQSADSLRKEAAKLSDSLLRQSMPTFRNYGEEFSKQWQLNVPHELHYPFDGSLHLPNPMIPYLDIDPQYINPDNNSPHQWKIDPIPPDDFFEQGVPPSPFYYIPPENTRRMPSPKIEPFKKDEKKNPIRDFRGWYYEKVADIGK